VSGRDSTLGWSIRQCRDLRGSGLSWLLPKAICSVHEEQMDRVISAGWVVRISHGYQGLEACVKIAIYGTLFGLLALWRGSLRPGMMAHAGSDIMSGIFRI
jgi:hypothetical protein